MNKNDKEFLVQKIRTEYTEKRDSDLDRLTALDKKVKLPAVVFGYVFGSVSALIMGSGMSLIMTDIANVLGMTSPTVPGIVIGALGLLMAICNYPIYKRILTSRRKQYAGEIITLSDRITKG